MNTQNLHTEQMLHTLEMRNRQGNTLAFPYSVLMGSLLSGVARAGLLRFGSGQKVNFLVVLRV